MLKNHTFGRRVGREWGFVVLFSLFFQYILSFSETEM